MRSNVTIKIVVGFTLRGPPCILDTAAAVGRRLFCLRYNQPTSTVLAQCPDVPWPRRLTHNPWNLPTTGSRVRACSGQELQATDFHIGLFQSTTRTNPRRSVKRDMYSRDGARSAIGMGYSSWNRAKRGFSLFLI